MDKRDGENKKREMWRIWDGLLTSGIFAFMNDAEEARHDDKKFKDMLWSLLFGVVFTAIIIFCVVKFIV